MKESMRRREFLFTALATSFVALAPPALAAPARFSSDRISVVVQGSGPDVVLIPGLTASRDMWKGLVAAVPGYRYHLVQVAGFAGAPAGGKARSTGAVLPGCSARPYPGAGLACEGQKVGDHQLRPLVLGPKALRLAVCFDEP